MAEVKRLTISGILALLKKMIPAPLIWAGMSAVLAFKFLINPRKFLYRNPDRPPLEKFPDPEELGGLTKQYLPVGANGVKIYTVDTGKFTPKRKLMLLLHGFPELWAMWEHQMKYFRDKYTVAAIDMRGYGLSSRPSEQSEYYIDRLVKDIVEVVEGLGYEQCILIGHDWGGKVAWTTAIMNPKMIERLVVISAPHPTAYKDPECFTFAQSLKSSYFQLFYARGLAELVVTNSDLSLINNSLETPEGAKPGEGNGPYNRGAIKPEEIERVKAALGQGPNERGYISAATAALNYYRGWVDNETWMPIKEADKACDGMLIGVPTLVLFGKNDAYFLETMFNKTSLKKHVREDFLRLPPALENCSHWCPQDVPLVINGKIEEFLGAKFPEEERRVQLASVSKV